MSLQLAAQHMASRGRGPDTQLVHMAPQEVAGLQALAKAHGGSLTLNPDTGLPEAGFLSKILPTLIGVGLSVASGGTLTPLMAAGITGAGYGVATGSLKKGLMAGLGAYGGAGLAGGLTAAGAAGAAGAAEAGAAGLGAVGPQTAAQLGTGLEASMAAQGITPTIGATGASMGAQTASQLGAGFQADMAAQGIQPSAIQAQQAVMQAAPQTVTPMADRFAQAGRGFTNLGTEAGREAFMGNAASKGVEATGVGGAKGLMQYGLAGLSPMMMQDPQRLPEKEKLKPFEYSFDYGRAANPQAGYTGAATGERTYFNPIYTRTAAGGGLMDIGPVEAMSRGNQSQIAPAYAQGGVSDMAVNPYTGAETFAKGGISNLGDYSDGGRLLKGPGDGVSDSIPATIADKRPARLADGEFVVPARIVSELGNGSTEAGARRLYAMMDRIQKARGKTVGKGKVAVDTKAERMLPA